MTPGARQNPRTGWQCVCCLTRMGGEIGGKEDIVLRREIRLPGENGEVIGHISKEDPFTPRVETPVAFQFLQAPTGVPTCV